MIKESVQSLRLQAHISTDLDQYQPGQAVLIRVQCVDPITFAPPRASSAIESGGYPPMVKMPRLAVQVKDAAGGVVFSDTMQADGTPGSSNPRNSGRGNVGNTPSKVSLQSTDGVLVAAWQTSDSQPGGEYTIAVTLADAQGVVVQQPAGQGGASAQAMRVTMPSVERRIVILASRDRLMSVELAFDKDAYGQGDAVRASIKATRSSGAPAWRARVSGSARVGGQEVWQGEVVLDAAGRGALEFTLPAPLGPGAGSGADTLSVTVFDQDRAAGGTNQVESSSRAIPIATRAIDVLAYPEGGELVAGLPGRVYFEAALPSGDPADVTVAVCSAGDQAPLQGNAPSGSFGGGVMGSLGEFLSLGRDGGDGAAGPSSRGGVRGAGEGGVAAPSGCIVAARTQHEGRGVTPVFVVPSGAGQLELRILEPDSAARTLPLQAPRPFGVSMFAPESMYDGESAVKVLLASTHRGHVTVGMYKKEQMLCQVGVTLQGTAPISTAVNLVPQLSSSAVGVLRITVVESETGTPLAERLVFRAPPESSRVQLDARVTEMDAPTKLETSQMQYATSYDGLATKNTDAISHSSWESMPAVGQLGPAGAARNEPPAFAPGATVSLSVRARARGQDTPSLILVRVVDDQETSRVQRRRWQPRPMAQLLLESEVDALSGKPFGAPLPDAGAYLASVFPGSGVSERQAATGEEGDRGASPADATDLLLGTQGWRRFVYTDLAGALSPLAPSGPRFIPQQRGGGTPGGRPVFAAGRGADIGIDRDALAEEAAGYGDGNEGGPIGMPGISRAGPHAGSAPESAGEGDSRGIHGNEGADSQSSQQTLASLHWKRLFVPSKDRKDAEKIARAVCLAPTSSVSGYSPDIMYASATGVRPAGLVMARGGGGAANMKMYRMHAIRGEIMDRAFGAPVPMMAMADGAPEMAMAAGAAPAMEGAADFGAVHDVAAVPPARPAPSVVDKRSYNERHRQQRRAHFFQRVFAHRQVTNTNGASTDVRTDFAKTVAFGSVATSTGFAQLELGLPDTIGRFRIEVDVVSHSSLDQSAYSPAKLAQRNRGSATLQLGGEHTGLGAMTGYIRTAKPLSLAVAPLPVIGSEDQYLLPVLVGLSEPARDRASVSVRVDMGPYAAPMSWKYASDFIRSSGSAGTISPTEWNVIARPAKKEFVPDTVASDEPEAAFALLTAMNLTRGSSGDRAFLPLHGLLPRPERPVADISTQNPGRSSGQRVWKGNARKYAGQPTPAKVGVQTIRIAACRGCNPLPTPTPGARASQTKSTNKKAAHISGHQDAWEGSFKVESSGFLREEHASGVLSSEGDNEIKLTLPSKADVIPGSMRAAFALYQSPAATLGSALESLIQQPHGCFEQSSSTVYPMTMAMHYFNMHPSVPNAIKLKAQTLVEEGYKKLLTFECEGHPGGFEWFGCQGGRAGPHEALTAYGALQFLDMSTVWSGVDPALLKRVRSFLLSKRDGSGGFQRDSQALDSFGRAPPHTTDAYILWAMLSPSKMLREKNILRGLATELRAELDHAVQQLSRPIVRSTTSKQCTAQRSGRPILKGKPAAADASLTYANDPYFAALVALASMEAAEHVVETATRKESAVLATAMALSLLDAQQTSCSGGGSDSTAACYEGSVPGAVASITCSDGDGLRVETTSLAVLAWIKASEILQRYPGTSSAQDAMKLITAATQGVQWVLTQNRGGRFGTTQATVLALKAITKLDAVMAKRVAGTSFFMFDSKGKSVAEGTMPGVVTRSYAQGSSPLAPVLLKERPLLEAIDYSIQADAQSPEALVFRARLSGTSVRVQQQYTYIEYYDDTWSASTYRGAVGGQQGSEAVLPWSLKVSYRSRSAPQPETRQAGGEVKPASADADAAQLSIAVNLADTTMAEGRSTEMTVTVTNERASKGVPMTIAVVGVPAGLQLQPSQLQGLVAQGTIDAWEQRGRELLLYWRELDAGESKKAPVQLSAAGIGRFVGPTSKAYLYYDEDVVAYADAVTVTVQAAQ